mgnify:CR=1 FL=1
MIIVFEKGVELRVDITDQMRADWRRCSERAFVPGAPGKSCTGCSLDMDVLGDGLCELSVVTEELEKEVHDDQR